jgi:dolichol kinase/membrane-associated phospholipid phosphatase
MSALHDLLLAFSLLISNELIFTIIILLLAFFFSKSQKHNQAHSLLSLLFAFLLSMAFKSLVAQPRPCWLGSFSPIECPQDYSMPSIHSAVAFALAFSLIKTKRFLPSFLFAFLVAGTRVFLGVHSFEDIAGGLATSVLAVAISDRAFPNASAISHNKKAKKYFSKNYSELARKLVQIFSGLFLIAFIMLYGMQYAIIMLFSLLAFGAFIFHLKAIGCKLPVIDSLLDYFERPEGGHGEGAMSFVAGLLISTTMLPAKLAIISIMLLSFSDSLAAIAGKNSSLRLPHHPKKTYLGTAAFMAAAFPAYFIAGLSGVVMVIIAAIIESLPLGIDDNLLIPLSGFVFKIIK